MICPCRIRLWKKPTVICNVLVLPLHRDLLWVLWAENFAISLVNAIPVNKIFFSSRSVWMLSIIAGKNNLVRLLSFSSLPMECDKNDSRLCRLFGISQVEWQDSFSMSLLFPWSSHLQINCLFDQVTRLDGWKKEFSSPSLFLRSLHWWLNCV